MCRALCGPSHAGQEAEAEAFAPGEEAGRPAVTERSRPRPAGIGRLEPRLFTRDLLRSPALRHKIQTSLNKGKASNNLRKAVFFHRLGQIRDRAYENQQYRSLPFRFTPHGSYRRAGFRVTRAIERASLCHKARFCIPDLDRVLGDRAVTGELSGVI